MPSSKFAKINNQKIIAVIIDELPVFQFIIRAYISDDVNSFNEEKYLPNENNNIVSMTLNWSEFSFVANEILNYKLEMEKANEEYKKMAEKFKSDQKIN